MEIIKVKNVFGIKELRNASYIKGDTLLYAPNGVMKTSFADFLNCVKNKSSITDVFEEYSSPAEYEIKQFDKTYTESNNDGTLQIVVFSFKNAKVIVDNAVQVSEELMKQDIYLAPISDNQLRVALCSIPTDKVYGLAEKIRKAINRNK